MFGQRFSQYYYSYFRQQSEIVRELNIDKPSIYRIVLRYVNLNNETLVGMVTVTPETPNYINVEQKFMVNKLNTNIYKITMITVIAYYFQLKVQLKPTKNPTFVTVSGATGNIPSPFVMNPGRWAVTIKIDQSLFVVSIFFNQCVVPLILSNKLHAVQF